MPSTHAPAYQSRGFDMGAVCNAYCELAEEELVADVQMRKIPRRTDATLLSLAEEAQTQGNRQGLNGEQKFYLFYGFVQQKYMWKPHVFQTRFLKCILQAVAELLIGKDWAVYGVRIMRRFGWTKIIKQCMASAPRRFGKTVMMALVIISVAYCCTTRQCVFSTGQRACDAMRETVIKVLVDSGLSHWIRSSNKECVEIWNIDGKVSSMHFFPANPDVCCARAVVGSGGGRNACVLFQVRGRARSRLYHGYVYLLSYTLTRRTN